MKIFAIKSITWIEDHYEVEDSYDDFLFLSRDTAENKLKEIQESETEDTFIEVEREGVHYLVCYYDHFSPDIIISNNNAEDYLWKSTGSCWYYIKDLNVQ